MDQFTGTIKTISRKDWLKDMPELIKKLKLNYNFYYSNWRNGLYYTISKPITEVVVRNTKKCAHQIVLYRNKDTNDFYLVVFSKKNPTIYQCLEYPAGYNMPAYQSVKRFMNKFKLAYEGAVNYEIQSSYGADLRSGDIQQFNRES